MRTAGIAKRAEHFSENRNFVRLGTFEKIPRRRLAPRASNLCRRRRLAASGRRRRRNDADPAPPLPFMDSLLRTVPISEMPPIDVGFEGRQLRLQFAFALGGREQRTERHDGLAFVARRGSRDVGAFLRLTPPDGDLSRGPSARCCQRHRVSEARLRNAGARERKGGRLIASN